MSPWRASNLAASLGPAWDGDWWLDDVDVAIFTLPILDNLKDSDAAMRVLTAAYAQHISSRRGEARRPSMLLFDEFGSLAGGRALAINIVERARSSGAGSCSRRSRPPALAQSPNASASWLPAPPWCCSARPCRPGCPPWPGPNAPPRAPGRCQVAQMFHLTGWR
jgi:hypothetical protein